MQSTNLEERILALDTGSPMVSVAVSFGPGQTIVRSIQGARSSDSLLVNIRATLSAAGLSLGDLKGIVVLKGPGSFTGLRVGLATALGLHEALTVPVGTLQSLEVLAASAATSRVLAAVDALRGEWFTQNFSNAGLCEAAEEPILRVLPDQIPEGVEEIVGFNLQSGRAPRWRPMDPPRRDPGPLAPVALKLAVAGRVDWNPDSLRFPLYLRAAATTPSNPPWIEKS